ncbi:hypothetical protein ACFL5H_00275 [Candidatus Latescibacterota bacterium]
MLEFTNINTTALSNIETLLPTLLPGGRREGHEYVALNPTRDDHRPGSFKINMRTGAWSDFATGDRGSDVISLWAYINRVSQGEAAKAIKKQYDFSRLNSVKNRNPERSPWIQLNPVPEHAPEPPITHFRYGEISCRWEYRDADGRLIGFACRFEPPDGKIILPLTFRKNKNGQQEWRWQAFDEPRPLYGLDRLTSIKNAPVLLVEGEKCVDAAQEFLPELVVLAWPGGSKAIGKVDFSPLKNHTVMLWPDNDQPGRTAMKAVALILKKMDIETKVLIPPDGYPSGWDVADAIEEGWTERELHSFLESGPDEEESFWFVQKRKHGMLIKISQSRLRAFLESRGYQRLYINGSQQSMFVKVIDNIIEESSHERMKDAVLSYLKSQPLALTDRDGESVYREDILEAVERGAASYFGRDKLECLNPIERSFHRDSADSSHLYYRNGFVTVTRDGEVFHPYSELTGLVWRKKILDRDYLPVRMETSEFERFLLNVCDGDDKRKLGLETAIGYLLFRYKDSSVTKAIVLLDEQISDLPEGRTGKSLIFKALGKVRNTTVVDGKSFKFESPFAFQTVTPETDIIVFDDVGLKFPFENMFHMITGGLSYEQKNKPRIKLSYEDSPKYAVTSNYTISGEGGSADARKAEYELCSHYSSRYTPQEEFGHTFFSDWSDKEWALFDQYMIHCIATYLKYGLIENVPININTRKLIQSTSEDFVKWCDSTFKKDGEIDSEMLNRFLCNKTMYKQFCDEYETYGEQARIQRFTLVKFNKWLKFFARHSGLVIGDKFKKFSNKTVRGCVLASELHGTR